MKSYVLNPDGVTISKKAAEYHGIGNERMKKEGRSTDAVLNEFLKDARQVVAQGGCLVAHRLG